MKGKILCLAAMICAAMTATTATANSTTTTTNDAKISGRIKDANDKSAIIGLYIGDYPNFSTMSSPSARPSF